VYVKCKKGAGEVRGADYTITQTPIDCSSTLAIKTGAPASYTFPYNSVSDFSMGLWSAHFENSDPTNCAITSCTWSENTCGGVVSTNCAVTTGITVSECKANLHAGYTQQVCYSCSNHQYG
jgi:hypothetical protein